MVHGFTRAAPEGPLTGRPTSDEHQTPRVRRAERGGRAAAPSGPEWGG